MIMQNDYAVLESFYVLLSLKVIFEYQEVK